MKLQYSIDGNSALERKFRQAIPLAVGDKVVAKSLREAARPMLKRMQQLAPVGRGPQRSSLKTRERRGGATKKDIRIKSVKDKIGEVRVLVGVSKAKGKVGKRTHFIRQGIAGTRRARVGPRDFITQAYNQTLSTVQQNYESIMLKNIQNAFKRYGVQ